MKEYGVGIIGFGFMGKAHTYGYKTIPLYYQDLPFRTKLTGVCTAHRNTAEKPGFAWVCICCYRPG